MTTQLPLPKERLEYLLKYPEAASKRECQNLISTALAAYEQEPVAWRIHTPLTNVTYVELNSESVERVRIGCAEAKHDVEITPLYTHPAPSIPAAVPTFEEWCASAEQNPVGKDRFIMKLGYEACRAAMLQDSTPGKVKVKAGDPQLPGGIDPAIHQAINDALSTCVREAIRKECLPGGRVGLLAHAVRVPPQA